MARSLDPVWHDAKWKARFRRRLLAWYRRHARDLPWRGTRNPYAVWVSEIMLQQTQAATVAPYYRRFLQEFPTIRSLADADEERVLRQWEGLGYYRRARHLHRAAREVLNRHGGTFPRDPGAVRALPGVGRYTAGAVLSIAFDAREPILEANTIRLFSRLLAWRDDPRSSSGTDALWRFAEEILPRAGCGEFNQALMELGAEVCVPRGPDCGACPVAELCPTRRANLQEEIPSKKEPPRIETVRQAAVVVRRDEKLLLARQPDGGRWGGMWDFVRFEIPFDRDPTPQLLAARVRRLVGARLRNVRRLATLKHGVTRFRITLECFQADCAEVDPARAAASHSEIRWLSPANVADYPLSVTGRKIASLCADGARPLLRRPAPGAALPEERRRL